MALTDLQRTVCGIIAGNRIASGESYLAGATALNELIGAARVSRDIDLFHDTEEAVDAAWQADEAALQAQGLEVGVVRRVPGFVEAHVRRGAETVLMQWARDSAFRFFPLVEHHELGLTLHPFDLATNKVLALVGRLEARDWVDVIECDRRLQALGYLAWAACGKDPGFSPGSILEHAGRTARYSSAEVRELSFAGPVPDAAELSRRWHSMLDDARRIVAVLPPEEVGKCVLAAEGGLQRGTAADLDGALRERRLVFHAGTIRGALPRIVVPALTR
jgi:hypothetical protein